MLRPYLIAALLALAAPTRADWPGHWTKADTAFQLVSSGGILADRGQKRWTARHPATYFERSPLLGREPSVRRVDVYFAASLALHTAVSIAYSMHTVDPGNLSCCSGRREPWPGIGALEAVLAPCSMQEPRSWPPGGWAAPPGQRLPAQILGVAHRMPRVAGCSRQFQLVHPPDGGQDDPLTITHAAPPNGQGSQGCAPAHCPRAAPEEALDTAARRGNDLLIARPDGGTHKREAAADRILRRAMGRASRVVACRRQCRRDGCSFPNGEADR